MDSDFKLVLWLFYLFFLSSVSLRRYSEFAVVYRGNILGNETKDQLRNKIRYWRDYAKEHRVFMCIEGKWEGIEQRCNFQYATLVDFPEFPGDSSPVPTAAPTESPIDYYWFEISTSILLDLRPDTLVHSSFYLDELKKYDNVDVYVIGKTPNHPVLSIRGDYNFQMLDDIGSVVGVAPEVIITGVEDDLLFMVSIFDGSRIITPGHALPKPPLRVVSSNWVGIDRMIYTLNILSDDAYYIHTGYDLFLDNVVEAYNLTNIIDVSQQIRSEESVLLYFWANPFSICMGVFECVRDDLRTTIEMLEGFGNTLVFNLDELVYHEEDFWERMIPFMEKQGFDIKIFIEGYPSTSYMDFESDIFLDYLAAWDLEMFYERAEVIPSDIEDMMDKVQRYVVNLN